MMVFFLKQFLCQLKAKRVLALQTANYRTCHKMNKFIGPLDQKRLTIQNSIENVDCLQNFVITQGAKWIERTWNAVKGLPPKIIYKYYIFVIRT